MFLKSTVIHRQLMISEQMNQSEACFDQKFPLAEVGLDIIGKKPTRGSGKRANSILS